MKRQWNGGPYDIDKIGIKSDEKRGRLIFV